MSAEGNIKEVLSAQMEIISGLKKTKGLQRKYLEKIKREDIYSPENRISLKNTSVYIKEFPYLEGKLIAVLGCPQILDKGYKIYLKDIKSGFSWQTTVLLEKKLYKFFDYLE